MDFEKRMLRLGIDYESLRSSIPLEMITTGRYGANIMIPNKDSIPIVRTTTRYTLPRQPFQSLHHKIKDEISDYEFNHALVECYTHEYRSMQYHSDQSMDLKDDSMIAIYSHYKNPNPFSNRILRVKRKDNKLTFDIVLEHESVVLFSVKTNEEYVHKIFCNHDDTSNEWLGITFQCSKRFIRFINEIPYFEDGKTELKLTNREQEIEFYKFRRWHSYPEDYAFTISPSDCIRPVLSNHLDSM